MPVNRNALLRHQVIDKCLRNRLRRWTWKGILEKVNEALLEDNPKSKGVGKTTFFKDLKDIEYDIYKADIKRTVEGKTTYYSYADEKYSISNQPLNETEAKQLKSAIMVLSRFKGMPQFEWTNEIIPLLESKMGLVRTDKEVITFESNPDYIGLPNIPTLFNAIANKKVVKITYRDFKSSVAYDVELHPYHLRQYNSRWFVFGYNPSWPDNIQNLALDRIKKIEEMAEKYKSDDTNWDDYFADMIGVTKFNLTPIEIKIFIVDAEQAAYIQTKPIHQTQKQIRQVENGFETSIKVIPNYELESLILSFGERIKIISPISLVNSLKARVEKTIGNYNLNIN
jgi:predicted DNA-binding transcriptional regulator YafY